MMSLGVAGRVSWDSASSLVAVTYNNIKCKQSISFCCLHVSDTFTIQYVQYHHLTTLKNTHVSPKKEGVFTLLEMGHHD